MSEKINDQKEKKMPAIQSTKQYDIFQKMQGNRDIDHYYLKRLAESIKNNNHLELHPIIVDKNLNVIDGQHRLEVAKNLDLDIYYILSENVTESHLIDSNVNQKSWEIEDYINHFAAKHVPAYIELKRMLKVSNLKPKALITLLCGNVNIPILNKLKLGKFDLPQDDKEHILNFFFEFMTYVRDKRVKPYSMFTNFNFTKALRWLYKTSGFDKEVIFKKLDQKWFDLRPQSSSEEWYRLLIGIYNFKNQNKLAEEFLSDK